MNSKDMNVTVSIVTHNSDKIFLSLDALINTLGDDQTIQIKIFDNASEPAYRKRLSKYLTYSFVTIDFYKENKGFGFGHNSNLLNTSGYGIIFNPDIILSENQLKEMVTHLASRPECALLAPKILNEDGTTQYLIRNHLNVFDYILRFVPFKFIKKMFANRLAKFECRGLPDDQDSYVRMISGSFMVVDLAKFNQIAGFDERYFMYFEDNDLCRKVEQAEYKVIYSPQFSVTHLYERGAVKNRKLFFIFLQSMGKYFHKWGWQFF
ncbi:glycosyltransferase family 2 protein [Enterococcus dongliensis]|uniref:Glycosyltransferase family 2 protein n=1 Tax=Enterococcus dongliensis TaxID=2559925 RepID=A0AAP5KUE6_9ENTE|nr:glycosyltransferase family 2 protein [Enterococcus dongliensis]MDT2596852.1 glycosyltransferase family 2 protein [Enterococcus dongliensis]MDT2603129.1 glycosyltransferase family 2 protein [Enterococcus dongliensis]MDT2613734.1 glycosyltransferase family 2 protein [Enterococcus dongliensis]MDT2633474.1 glycosyltransferase family 2 protein [Enterococcus dongliensis]MDT2636152.1 glycosyltransferase family 2 protein [Enterococcus dongliensis]